MKKKIPFIFFLLFTLLISQVACFSREKHEFYQIKIYHLKSSDQLNMVDNYLQNALLPALHRTGIKQVGVCKPIANDTAALKFIYVL
ncbi:MAG: NIPSNAP family containing protein, partial [Ginsengibacter sp.]